MKWLFGSGWLMSTKKEICMLSQIHYWTATIYAVYNRLAGMKQVHTYHSEHWVPGEHQELKREWIANQFSKTR